MTKETQVSANRGHIRSDGFQMPALLQDKFPPGPTPDNPDSPQGLQVCLPCRHAGLQRAPPLHPPTAGNAQLVRGARASPKSLSRPVKAGPDPWGHVVPPCPVLRACTRPWALHRGVGQMLPNSHPCSRGLPEEQTTAQLFRCLTWAMALGKDGR